MTDTDLTQLPTSRKDALKRGEMYFFSGKECPHGHVDKRSTGNSTCYSCAAVRSKKWRDSHPERMCELVRKSKKKFRERDRAGLQLWRENNRESVRVHNAHRLLRKKNAEGFYKKEDINRILVAQNFKCTACKKDISDAYHVDHIMPLALGGTNWPDNLQCLCPRCNCSKKDLHPDKWLERISANADLVDA